MESKDYRSPEILPHSAEVTDIHVRAFLKPQ